jgi:dTDP-4-amino-4,6-dideoxygalactose transaminase
LPAPAEVLPLLEEMHSNRWYSNFGPLVRRFEAEMEAFLARENGARGVAVATFSSATTALELALRAIQLTPGSKVLVPALTFPATALAVMNAGHIPVLTDVDAETWEMSAVDARRACAAGDYAAVIPVAAYGRPVDGAPWAEFQEQTGVPVLMDVAAALGQQPVDDGLTYCFSLHATKPFGVGEGGLLVSQDQDMITRSRSLSNFGFSGPAGVIQQAGTNAKFGEYYAAMGLSQIARWPALIARRREVLESYLTAIRPLSNKVGLQKSVGDFVPAVFPVYVKDGAGSLIARLDEAGIQTRRWYLPPLYEHPALAGVSGTVGDEPSAFPVCEELKHSLVGLPFHSFLSNEDVQKIIRIVSEEAA